MTFRVVDENGKKIAESMNLDELKFNLKDRVQESISAVADDGIGAKRAAYLELCRFTTMLRTKTTWF